MKQCGNVSNYYGGVWVKEEDGEYFGESRIGTLYTGSRAQNTCTTR